MSDQHYQDLFSAFTATGRVFSSDAGNPLEKHHREYMALHDKAIDASTGDAQKAHKTAAGAHLDAADAISEHGAAHPRALRASAHANALSEKLGMSSRRPNGHRLKSRPG